MSTKPATKTREHDNAKRALRNFASAIARPANWNGSLERGYAVAFAAVLAVEDAHGIAAAAALSDRLDLLGERAGLDRSVRFEIDRQIVHGTHASRVTF